VVSGGRAGGGTEMLLDLSEIVIREGMRSSIAVDQPGV
jgi:hypothetical protein